jgi:hypothetical protein
MTTVECIPPQKSFIDRRCSGATGVFYYISMNMIIALREPIGQRSQVQGEAKEGPFLNVHGECASDLR